ncbi:MAG: thioredoxin [Oscillospiraceae bacterium]
MLALSLLRQTSIQGIELHLKVLKNATIFNDPVGHNTKVPQNKTKRRNVIMSVITLTSENFEAEVLSSDKPVLIDFWASWCGPCRMLSPIVDEIANEQTGVKVCKINVDEQAELASRYGVMSIPTVVLMDGGKVKSKSVGAVPKSTLLDMLK